ncbi:restriction endonuclease subunit S [Microbacterium sp. NPDC058342]|uniref:restriction endonuclease subunit S n=1 Tax=Microbacterium sp. NPDC058342 TaxID=3346454 RepID=UPI00365D79D7
MSEWEETTLGEVVTASRDRIDPRQLGDIELTHFSIPAFDDSKQPVVEPAAGIKSHKFAVPVESVLVSMLNPRIQRTWKVPGGRSHVCSTEFAVLTSKDPTRLMLEYLFLLCDERSFAEKLDIRSRGTTGSRKRSKIEDVLGLTVWLPTIEEQRRVVDLMSAVDTHVENLRSEHARCLTAYAHTSGVLWNEEDGTEAAGRPFSQLMKLDVERRRLEMNESYRSAGVLNAGQGLIDKGVFRGEDTGYEVMNVLRAGQVVMRKLTAWEGPITVVPNEFDGYLASNEFPTFTLNDGISARWIKHVCRSSRLWGEMKSRVTGSVQRRKRLSAEQLLTVSLPVPSHSAQERTASALDSFDHVAAALSSELATLRSYRARLLTSLLNQEIEIPDSYDRLLEEVS